MTASISGGPVRETALRGMKITSVDLFYAITGAAGTAVAVAGYLVSWGAEGTIPASAAITGSKDETDAVCYSVDEHRVVWTPTTPAFIGGQEAA